MPEGPEVRRMALSLSKRVSGRMLVDIEVLSGRYLKKKIEGLAEATKNLPAKINGVGVHGKFSYWIINNDYFLWTTLGMTGGWSKTRTKHSRVRFVLDDGEVFYTDMRNFGTLKFVLGRKRLISKLNKMGPDMLASDITDEDFKNRIFKKPNWEICRAIMSQDIISGVGNYVKSDALWLARIHPKKEVRSLTDKEISNLSAAIKKVLKTSYESGGATIRTYRGLNDEMGEYSQRFLVYSRKIDADGNSVIKEKTSDGRTTHWSPSRQNK